MRGWTLTLVWLACVSIGALAGYFLGYLLWQAGFVLIGSAVALVGAGVGGILAFFGFQAWSANRS